MRRAGMNDINPTVVKSKNDDQYKNPKPKDAFTFGRTCPDCAGGLQFKWDRMKFRPKRKVWVCPACYEIELEGLPPINTVGRASEEEECPVE
ncbi:hypothetical protein ERK16_73 [Mycobacterium phage Erk16]|uniref:Uncharacterized protein n=1 Tax=Mycobacterium phage Erk16 TaxID=2234027 RepID=A0A2Z4Q0X8_9CAUD|nr:hypothetical protein ERK16_73 [Mycobacterium phage Erk16]